MGGVAYHSHDVLTSSCNLFFFFAEKSRRYVLIDGEDYNLCLRMYMQDHCEIRNSSFMTQRTNSSRMLKGRYLPE